MRLTIAMIDALSSVLAEAEAGGFQVHTQHMSEKEALRFEANAKKARAWIDSQYDRRAKKPKHTPNPDGLDGLRGLLK